LEHGASAAASAQDGDPLAGASVQSGFAGVSIGVAHDNKVLARFPKPEHLRAAARFARVKQSFVAGQIGGWFRQGEIQNLNVGGH